MATNSTMKVFISSTEYLYATKGSNGWTIHWIDDDDGLATAAYQAGNGFIINDVILSGVRAHDMYFIAVLNALSDVVDLMIMIEEGQD